MRLSKQRSNGLGMDLFSLTAPLAVRFPNGTKHIMAEYFPHPEGILYFEPFWHQDSTEQRIHLLKGELKGDGPWKIGDGVIAVIGCQGTDPELALELAQWQDHLMMTGNEYLPHADILTAAREHGAGV
jgi:hypothetical protein